MTQIGVLVPRSAIYPSLNFDLMEGLKLSLQRAGIVDIQIKTAGIGVAGSDKEIYSACEKLIFEGVEILVGYINPSTAEMMHDMLRNAGVLFINLDAGYHIPKEGLLLEHVFSVSLQGTLACRMLGRVAADKGDVNFANYCSFYDAGYRAPFGFFNGLADVGSNVVFNHVTKLLKIEFTIEPLTDFLDEHVGAAVFAATCGDMLADLFEAFAASPVYTRHNIYLAPFAAEEQWLAKSVYPGKNGTAIVPWATELQNDENALFVSELKKRNKIANVFSLLSWEAGMLVVTALKVDGVKERIALLEQSSFVGPRGTLTMNRETHNFDAPMYLAEIFKNEETGFCSLKIEDRVNEVLISDNRDKLLQEIRGFVGGATSWYNAYGCLEQ